MSNGALTTSTYPHDPIRLACAKCGRQGRYRRASLIERFGPNAPMPSVLSQLAECPRRGNASDPCGALYPDLARKARRDQKDI